MYWPAMTALTPPAMPPAPKPAVFYPTTPPVIDCIDGKAIGGTTAWLGYPPSEVRIAFI